MQEASKGPHDRGGQAVVDSHARGRPASGRTAVVGGCRWRAGSRRSLARSLPFGICPPPPPPRADNGIQKTYLLTAGAQDITMAYNLPAGLACSGGCVLQWTWKTWNSCVDPCPASECGSAYAARLNPVVGNGPLDYCVSPTVPNGVVPEIFKNCADIMILAVSRPAHQSKNPNPRPTGPLVIMSAHYLGGEPAGPAAGANA